MSLGCGAPQARGLPAPSWVNRRRVSASPCQGIVTPLGRQDHPPLNNGIKPTRVRHGASFRTTTSQVRCWLHRRRDSRLRCTRGVAVAAIPDSGTGAISACREKVTGLVRIIDKQAGKSCGSWETSVSWNNQGAVGATGATGARGQQGVPGNDDKDAVGLNRVTVVSGPRPAPTFIDLSQTPTWPNDRPFVVFESAQLTVTGTGPQIVRISASVKLDGNGDRPDVKRVSIADAQFNGDYDPATGYLEPCGNWNDGNWDGIGTYEIFVDGAAFTGVNPTRWVDPGVHTVTLGFNPIPRCSSPIPTQGHSIFQTQTFGASVEQL